jgi:ADP-ribosylglycohydrolase
MSAESTLQDRALGAFYGLAIGDALGMPTQLLSRAQVAGLYGQLDGFEPGPELNPISAGMAAATVTDDTDQAVIVARMLLEGDGHVDHRRLASELMSWEQRMRAKGSLDLLGPSTKRALEAFADGQLDGAGSSGDTNGAAMRVTPVGIATPIGATNFSSTNLVERVIEGSSLTHNTSVALSGALAVAGAVSAALEGASTSAALQNGAEFAELGAARGNHVAGAHVARKIRWAIELVEGKALDRALADIDELIGTSVATQEAVPAAFAIAAISPDDPWRAALLAAGLGGDSDTVAAMAGAMVGAATGIRAFPERALSEIRLANPELELDRLTADLLALRMRSSLYA